MRSSRSKTWAHWSWLCSGHGELIARRECTAKLPSQLIDRVRYRKRPIGDATAPTPKEHRPNSCDKERAEPGVSRIALEAPGLPCNLPIIRLGLLRPSLFGMHARHMMPRSFFFFLCFSFFGDGWSTQVVFVQTIGYGCRQEGAARVTRGICFLMYRQ